MDFGCHEPVGITTAFGGSTLSCILCCTCAKLELAALKPAASTKAIAATPVLRLLICATLVRRLLLCLFAKLLLAVIPSASGVPSTRRCCVRWGGGARDLLLHKLSFPKQIPRAENLPSEKSVSRGRRRCASALTVLP